MELRIYRTWRWVAAWVPMIGQKVPMRLEPTDELQYRNHKNEWLPLPVVDAEKPEHPDEAESRRHNKEMQAAVDRLVADGKIKFPNV